MRITFFAQCVEKLGVIAVSDYSEKLTIETLKESRKEMKSLDAKLQIAVDVLERYAEKEHWDWDRDIYGEFKLDTKNVFLSDKLGYTKAHDALEKIRGC